MISGLMYNHRKGLLHLRLIFIISSILFLTLGILFDAESQPDDVIILSVAPLFPMPDVFTDELFATFESEHPNVQVVVAENPSTIYYPNGDIQNYLNQMTQYARSADVISVTNTFTPMATRASIVLALDPLIAADPAFDPTASYHPAVWNAFNWDMHIWALPAATTMTVLAYNPPAFDAQNVSYPRPDWTLEDYGDAARRLASYDSNGNVQAPGLAYGRVSPARVIASLASGALIGADGLPNFDQPELESILSAWSILTDEGVIAEDSQNNSTAMFLTDRVSFNENNSYRYTTLPGGNVWLEASGFAVSQGTAHPQLAYELAKYLTRDPLLAAYYGNFPARLDVSTNVSEAGPRESEVDLEFITPTLAIFNELAEYIIPYSDRLYNSYLHLPTIRADSDNARPLLQEAQLQVIEDLETAEAYSGTVQITVSEPVLPATAMPGQVILHFGMNIGSPIIPNEPLLQQFAFEFALNHPNIQEIRIEPSSAEPNQLATHFDCFYSNENIVFDLDLANILSLDPLLNADPNFVPSDLIGNTLEQLQRDGRTWAYPLGIRPYVLRYNPAVFNQYAISQPHSDWHTDEFDTVLRSVWEQTGESTPVLEPLFGTGNTYVLMLIAAHGGLLFGYSTDPPLVNLTSAETISAVGNVLDLAREGIIGYVPLNPDRSSSILYGAPPILVDNLKSELPFNYSSYQIIGFPIGSQYRPVSYSIGTAYISVQSTDPQLCYEWIGALAQRPDLLNNFPTTLGIPDISISVNQLGQNAGEFFDIFVSYLGMSDTIIIPERQDFYETRWVNQAFDRYVLEEANLVDVLAEAQALIEAYRVCRANQPNLNDRECAEQVDNTV